MLPLSFLFRARRPGTRVALPQTPFFSLAVNAQLQGPARTDLLHLPGHRRRPGRRGGVAYLNGEISLLPSGSCEFAVMPPALRPLGIFASTYSAYASLGGISYQLAP
jgi:hypothetical protein